MGKLSELPIIWPVDVLAESMHGEKHAEVAPICGARSAPQREELGRENEAEV